MERDNQDKQWGGPEHDDKHNEFDWVFFIDKQLSCVDDFDDVRGRFVKIAAIALAAVESIDRKENANGTAVQA